MQKQFRLLLATVSVIGFLSTSCYHKGASGKAYSLKMRLNKGDKFGQHLNADMTMKMSVMSQPVDMKMHMESRNSFVADNDSAGNKLLRMTYNNVVYQMWMEGMPGLNDQFKNTNDAGKKMEGKTIILKLDAKNQIADVGGFEDTMWNDSTDAATREVIKKMFSKDQINSMFGLMFAVYPDKPVKVGDEWERDGGYTMAGIKTNMTMHFKLKAVKDKIASIDVKGTVNGKGTMDQGGVALEMEMDGGQEGDINIGIADGYLKDSKLKTDISGNMTIMGQKLSITISMNYVVKGN